jgi:hypothetical protein
VDGVVTEAVKNSESAWARSAIPAYKTDAASRDNFNLHFAIGASLDGCAFATIDWRCIDLSLFVKPLRRIQ